MPASARSLLLTDVYRDRLAGIVRRQVVLARDSWPSIEDFDQGAEAWREQTARGVAQAQQEAVRATAGYLAAYVSSELGRRVTPPLIDSGLYTGKSRDGRSLTESLRSPIIRTLAALKEGRFPQAAVGLGLNAALWKVEVDLMHAARSSLNDGMEADPRIEGWQRAVRGTCGACLGDVAVEVSVQLPSLPLMVHPNCQCVTQPVVIGVPNRFPLPTGEERFNAMSREEQDRELGPAAERIRAGEIALAALVATSEQETAEDFITQAPAKDA